MESELTSCNPAFVRILSCPAAWGHCTTPHPSLKPPWGFVGQGIWGLGAQPGGVGLAALGLWGDGVSALAPRDHADHSSLSLTS